MKVSEFIEKTGLTVVTPGDADREITGGYVGDLLSWVMGRAQSGDAWITIMTSVNVVAVAVLADVACVVLAENVEPDEAAVAKAKAQDVCLLRSEKSAYQLAAALAGLL